MRSVRYEFTKPTRRAALVRSGGRCEAIGEVYGLLLDQRCNVSLNSKEFDHYPVPATEKGSDKVANCVVCCPTCHARKTRAFDIPIQAKTKRVSDKHNGIRAPSKLTGAGFRPAQPQRSASRKTQKWSLLNDR